MWLSDCSPAAVFSVAWIPNKWYQSNRGLMWDRMSIPRALVAVRWRSYVDLVAALGLLVGSCVDLKTAFGLLEESDLVE